MAAAPRLLIPDLATVRLTEHWHVVKDGDPAALALYERHYSAHRYRDGRVRKIFVGPGEKLVLLTKFADALFVWRKFIDGSGQQGINCAVFRSEGDYVASDLIRQAERVAYCRWPGARMYTYVDPKAVVGEIPGYCFKRAGWKRCGVTKGGLDIWERLGVDIRPRAKKQEAKAS